MQAVINKIDDTGRLEMEFSCSQWFSFTQVTTTLLQSVIQNLSNSSCSLDVVPGWVLKKAAGILDGLLYLINMCLLRGVFPFEWKQGLISPLIKNNKLDSESLPNYRPVTSISMFAKSLEKVVLLQLVDFLHSTCNFPTMQSAHSKGRSCETLLLFCQQTIASGLDNNQKVLMISLDLSAAFDTVNLTLLLDSL